MVRRWYEEAEAEGLFEPDAMALATATPDGRPSVRMVLVRGADERDLRVYTNHESRKAGELRTNGAAALETIPWLSPIMPVWSFSQTRNARLRSDV